MTAIQQSRLWNNLWRDLHNEYPQDESLSILNTSSDDIEVTDNETGITKIIYPRTILRTNRPNKSITIITNVDEDNRTRRFSVTIPRSAIKKDIIAIETPSKFSNSTETYSEFLSLNWVNRVLRSADRIIITNKHIYYILVDDIINSHHNLIIFILVLLILVCIVCIFLY